jgi:CRISPR-associated endonuclease/helicase Cas3
LISTHQAKQFAAHTPANGSDTWHGLKEHLNDVAQKARWYSEKFGCGDLGYYAGLWHDLGKYNPKFQQYLELCHVASCQGESEPRDRVPHAIYGAKLAAEEFEPLALLIAGHHTGLQTLSKLENHLIERVDNLIYQTILQKALEEEIKLKIVPEVSQQLERLVQDKYSYDLLLRLLFSCLVDADYLDTEEHFDPESARQRGSNITVSALWETLKTSQLQLLEKAKELPTTVNQVRAEVYKSCIAASTNETGLFRLAVPTGGGKTRSGLAFALAHAVKNNLDRVIVAVPYTSIIEQTVGVYRSIFGEDAVLEHHSAVQPDDRNEEDARSRQAQARLATQNWDAPLIVTTTVQLFESLFANRTSRCRKLHNIVRSVIILDEVQTLPVSLLDPILSVLKELCEQYQVSVVLCTATQPALEGKTPYLSGFTTGTVRDIVPPTVAKKHFSALSRVNYTVPQDEWSWNRLAQDLQQHEQALVILNTRKDALAVLDELPSSESERIFHLSTLLCGQHRREVLRIVRDRLTNNQPSLLISTQVVEAGVDLDFPTVYRAIGPLDRIVQAAGRCNREGRRVEKGQVIIFRPQDGKIPNGEYRKAFGETDILLKRENLDLDDPAIFETYFRRLYQGLDSDKKEIQKYRHFETLDFCKVAERFKLIPDDTTSVLIDYDDRASELIQTIRRYGLKSGSFKKLQPYLVSLRNHDFKKTEELRELLSPGVWLWQGGYDKKLKGIAIGDQAIVHDPADLIF